MKVAAYFEPAGDRPLSRMAVRDDRAPTFADLVGDAGAGRSRVSANEASAPAVRRPRPLEAEDLVIAPPVPGQSRGLAFAVDPVLDGTGRGDLAETDQIAGGRLGAEPLTRGLRFDELGMFGTFAAIGDPRPPHDVDGEIDVAARTLGGEGGAALVTGAGLDASSPEAGVVADDPGAPDGERVADRAAGGPLLGWPLMGRADGEVVIAPEPGVGDRATTAGSIDAQDGAGQGSDSPFERKTDILHDAGEAPPEAATPLRITLHDAGDGVSLAAAAPLGHADQVRVWRSVKDHADRLGLALRDFHLNGWAGDGRTPVRRDRHGG